MRGPAVVYVGNLPNDIKERELQELFDKVPSRPLPALKRVSRPQLLTYVYSCICLLQFGAIRAIDIKIPPRPPPFAFIEFAEPR
jgi:RNA recognition motif-containing protein